MACSFSVKSSFFLLLFVTNIFSYFSISYNEPFAIKILFCTYCYSVFFEEFPVSPFHDCLRLPVNQVVLICKDLLAHTALSMTLEVALSLVVTDLGRLPLGTTLGTGWYAIKGFRNSPSGSHMQGMLYSVKTRVPKLGGLPLFSFSYATRSVCNLGFLVFCF